MKQEDIPYKFITKEDLTYLVFPRWEHESALIHGFTTRSGGVSTGDLSKLNLGFNRGDKREHVYENYHRICNALDVPFESLVLSKQVHETRIIKVCKDDRGNGILRENAWESVDGFFTTERGITLVTHYADCVPLFFYAPGYDMIGMAHSGWRGTVGRIGAKMIKALEDEGIPIEAIQVAIGPSIGPCCFEVGEDVAKAFTKEFGDEAISFYSEESHKPHINLWKCNEKLLIETGLEKSQIINTQLCTCCHSDIFFSHRKTNGQRGTLGAMMYLK